MYRSFSQFLENRDYWGSQGAGVLVIAEDIGKWLVAFRSARVRVPNTWGVIGGKIDPEDQADPSGAARREFTEETGYNGPIKLMKAYIWQSPEIDTTTNSPLFVYHNFIGTIRKGSWEPKLNWETDHFAWVTYEELLDLNPKHYGLKALIKNSGGLIRSLSEKHS